MARAKNLRMGVEGPSPAEARERIVVLRATVEKYLPGFAKSVAKLVAEPGGEGVVVVCTRTPLRRVMTRMNICC